MSPPSARAAPDIVARGIAEERVTVIPNAVDADKFRDGAVCADDRSSSNWGWRRACSFSSVVLLPGIGPAVDAFAAIHAGAGRAHSAFRWWAREDHQGAGAAPQHQSTNCSPCRRTAKCNDTISSICWSIRLPGSLTELVTPPSRWKRWQKGDCSSPPIGGHRELIRDGETGWLFRAGDARDLAAVVLRTLEERANWSAVRAAGRRYVESERNWTVSVARYRGVYGVPYAAAEVADAG